MVAPMRRRIALPHLRAAYKVSERRACRVLAVCRATVQYRSVKSDDPVLRMRIKEIAAARICYGCPRVHVLLRREGWKVNRKRVYRIYREEGLSMRNKTPRRRKCAVIRRERQPIVAVNHTWSMDFMADNLADGRKIRLLTVVDNFSRECIAEVGTAFTGGAVQPYSVARFVIVARRASFAVITARNSCQKPSTSGRIGTRLNSTSRGLESLRTTRFANPSTGAFGKSCSTQVGSSRLPMRRRKQRFGVRNTTTTARTDHYRI